MARVEPTLTIPNYLAVLDLTAAEITAGAVGGFYTAEFDLRSISRGGWTLYVIPSGGATTYSLNAIFEQTAEGLPDTSDPAKIIERKAAAAVAVLTLDEIDEPIPWLQVKITDPIAGTSVKFILSGLSH